MQTPSTPQDINGIVSSEDTDTVGYRQPVITTVIEPNNPVGQVKQTILIDRSHS